MGCCSLGGSWKYRTGLTNFGDDQARAKVRANEVRLVFG